MGLTASSGLLILAVGSRSQLGDFSPYSGPVVRDTPFMAKSYHESIQLSSKLTLAFEKSHRSFRGQKKDGL